MVSADPGANPAIAAADGTIGMMTGSVQNIRKGQGNGACLLVGRRVRVRSGKIVKMALQISMVETAANLENRCFGLKASVCSAESPTTFVGGVSSGKSRISIVLAPGEPAEIHKGWPIFISCCAIFVVVSFPWIWFEWPNHSCHEGLCGAEEDCCG